MNTKEKILFEAEEQFIQNGIAVTQVKEIAEAIGISRRTVYRYFATKDELAFAVEMVVMNQIVSYLNGVAATIHSDLSGIQQIESYFGLVDLNAISKQMRFTAEFDRYFQKEYPDILLEKEFTAELSPQKDKLYHIIESGQKDGSIRRDLSALEIFQFISQSFIALEQRLVLRETHLKHEFCKGINFTQLFKEIILKGIAH